MTKLYHGPEGQGWQIPGQQERKAARVDVPNGPAELAAWLNERRVTAELPSEPIDRAAELEDHAGDAAAYVRGPKTKDPPRISPAFLGDLEAGAEFVPIARAADIDRLLERCPKCHGGALANVMRWIAEAPSEDLERAAALIADNLADRLNDNEGEGEPK
jgi:hypothetical protein